MRGDWRGWLTCAAALGGATGCAAGVDPAEERPDAAPADSHDGAPAPFARSFALTRFGRVLGFATGPGGPLVVAGSAMGPQDIGAGLPTTPPPDQASAFILGFDTRGEPRYSQFFPGATLGAVAVDDAGDTLVTGGLRRQATFAEISTREAGAYVARLDPRGHVRWVQLLRGARAAGQAIALDATGDALVGGRFGVELDSGRGHLTGADNVFLARLRSSGEIAWAKSFWGEAPQEIRQIAVGAGGRAVIAGTFSDHMGLGETVLTSQGGTDVFLGAIEADGRVAWAGSYGGAGDDDPPRLALAPDASILLAGVFRGQLDLGADRLEAHDTARIYVARFDPEGRARWAVPLTPGPEPALTAIALAPSGSVVLAGTSRDPFGAEHGARPSPFLATLDSEGRVQKVEALPEDGSAEVRGLVIEPSGSMVLTGELERSLKLDGHVLRGPSIGDQQRNLFLARIAP